MIFQVNKSSSDFWNRLKLTWQQYADLPRQCWVSSVVELDGKVYISMLHSRGAHIDPLMYDFIKDQWSALPALPYSYFSLVTIRDRKQLLVTGGVISNDGVDKFSNKVFLWDGENKKWTTTYPIANVLTASCNCLSISHRSTVIVAGGVTRHSSLIVTTAVEVLYIKEHSVFNKSYWSMVEQLSFVVHEAVPLIINGTLYLAHEYGSRSRSTCNVLTAHLATRTATEQ